MALSVETRQRVSTPVDEFVIDMNEHVEGEVEFWSDMVDFCFEAKPASEDMTCFVQLFDYATRAPLFGGDAHVRLVEDAGDRRWLSFDGFGFDDDERAERVRRCRYEIWLDGTGGVRTWIYV